MPKLVNSLKLTVHGSYTKTVNREPKTLNRRDLRPAFTLIEILLTLFFSATLAILLLTAAGTLVQTHRSNLQTIAARIATKEIETLRNTAYTSLPGDGSVTDPDISKLPGGSAIRTMASYQSSADIKQATITVNWTEKGLAQTLSLNTLIYKNGL